MAPIQESDDYSLLHMERISQYVSLPPACLSNPLPAVCASIFSPLLLSYFPPARGIILAYKNVQLSSEPPASSEAQAKSAKSRRKARSQRAAHTHPESDTEDESEDEQQGERTLLLHIHNEYSAPFLWATASFLVWRPRAGAWIGARVTQQASTHLTLSHLNSFPVSILRQYLPDGWTWNANFSSGGVRGEGGIGTDEGYWADGDGMPIPDILRVRIRDFEGRMDGKGRGKGGLKIDGSLVTEEEEKARAAEGEDERRKRREGGVKVAKGKGKGVLKRSVLGEAEAVEVD